MSTIVPSLETVSNRLDGETSGGIPLVPSVGTLVKGAHLAVLDQWVHPMKDRSDDPSHHERTLYL